MLLSENISHDELKKYIKQFYTYALTRLKKIDRDPKIVFKRDQTNANNFFGKTGYYDPDEEKIALYVTDRHPKDILRSFAHELIHHHQKCSGESEKVDLSVTSDPSYSLHNHGLREMEKQAFKMGNMLFRDWCDIKKMEKKGENIMAESKKMTSAEKEKEKEIKKAMPDKEMKARYGERAKGIEAATAKKIAKKVAEEGKMPMKKDTEDVDGDGSTTDKVPAFLDKGDVKKKKSGGKVPPQLQKHVKGKMKKEARHDAKDQMKHKTGEDEKKLQKEETEQLQEGFVHPYPQLTEKKQELFKERFDTYNQWKFEELLKKAIK